MLNANQFWQNCDEERGWGDSSFGVHPSDNVVSAARRVQQRGLSLFGICHEIPVYFAASGFDWDVLGLRRAGGDIPEFGEIAASHGR
jgi:hypothetical protein